MPASSSVPLPLGFATNAAAELRLQSALLRVLAEQGPCPTLMNASPAASFTCAGRELRTAPGWWFAFSSDLDVVVVSPERVELQLTPTGDGVMGGKPFTWTLVKEGLRLVLYDDAEYPSSLFDVLTNRALSLCRDQLLTRMREEVESFSDRAFADADAAAPPFARPPAPADDGFSELQLRPASVSAAAAASAAIAIASETALAEAAAAADPAPPTFASFEEKLDWLRPRRASLSTEELRELINDADGDVQRAVALRPEFKGAI